MLPVGGIYNVGITQKRREVSKGNLSAFFAFGRSERRCYGISAKFSFSLEKITVTYGHIKQERIAKHGQYGEKKKFVAKMFSVYYNINNETGFMPFECGFAF